MRRFNYTDEQATYVIQEICLGVPVGQLLGQVRYLADLKLPAAPIDGHRCG
jgi:hypothetical protein